MYYFNILQPQIICDKAIKAIKKERDKLARETSQYLLNNKNRTLKGDMENYEKNLLLRDYNTLIRELEELGEFSTQQMKEIVKNGGRNGRCIF